MELSDLTNKTKKELTSKIEDLENFIAKKGIGSGYVSKVEKVQRRVNVVFFLGAITALVGLFTWISLRSDEDED